MCGNQQATRFESALKLRLYAPGEFAVRHPEHDDIERLTEGWWEIRRCRSWEANPKAIWSLTID